MEVRSTGIDLWPTRVTFFETPVDWAVNRQLADEAIAATHGGDGGIMDSAAKRRVRGILDKSAAGQTLKAHLFASKHLSNDALVYCSTCDKSFELQTSLYVHRQAHHKTTKK